MEYPEVIVFRDSAVTSTVLGIFGLTLSLFAAWIYLTSGEHGLIAFIFFTVAIFLLISSLKPTRSTLSPEGVEVKAWGETVFNKWSDIDDLRIYRQSGYLGVGRRFVTFQDETKTFQKHVFLAPINIYSKPVHVLNIIKSYREAALRNIGPID